MPNQNPGMKYLSYLFLVAVFASSLSSCAAPGGGVAQTQLGPHSGQKFVLVQRRSGARDSDPQAGHTIAIVIKVEQNMINGEQEIKASAGAHSDGPGGPLANVDALSVRLLQPSEAKTEPRKTGEARITKTIPAQGGKFRTVVAQAIASSSDFPDTTVELTIPGDQ